MLPDYSFIILTRTNVCIILFLGGVLMPTVLLARVSTDDQADRGTIETQIQFGTKYCDLHEIYKDDGVSGTIPLPKHPADDLLIEVC